MTPPTISEYAWYYLYHKPRYALDKRYRKRLDDFEELLRKAYKRGLFGSDKHKRG